jgi:integrase
MATSKRGNGEGSITRLADGRWQGRLTLDSGKRKAFYGKTRQEAASKLTAALRDRDRGLPVTAEKQTVAQYLAVWLETIKPSIRPKTWRRYAECVHLHLVPRLGKTPLSRLSVQQVEHFYARKRMDGLSATTVAHLHAVLHRALATAERQDLVTRNVAALADHPRLQRQEMHALTREQAHQLLAAAAGHCLEALYVLAVTTGMRQGELLGLRWTDIDLQDGWLCVRQALQYQPGKGYVFVEPKTATSRRRIKLPTVAVERLSQHRIRQYRERLALGPAWTDLNLVFPNTVGKPMDGIHLLRREFLPLLQRAGLPRIRFHDLRHTAATLLLSKRHASLNAVCQMLGHSNAAITVGVYGHVTGDMEHQTADAMDALFSGANARITGTE